MNALTGYVQGMQASDALNQTRARSALAEAVQSGDMTAARGAFARVNPEAAFSMQKLDAQEMRETAAKMMRGVMAASPDARPQAWGTVFQQARALGMDVSGVPEQYPGDEYVQILGGVLGLGNEERTEFERMIEMVGPEQARQAVMIRLGLEPGADTALRVGAQQQDRDPIAGLRARAQEAGLQPGTPEYAEFMVSGGNSGPQVVVNNMGPDTNKFSERSGTLLADEAAEIARIGQTAAGNLQSIDRLEELLASAPSGGVASLKQFLGEFGIETTGLSEIQAAQALINKLVPEQRAPGTGPMSDADLALFKQSLPRLINTAEGNKQIIETLRGIAKYDQQRGRIARDLQLGEITPQEADKRWSALTNPLGDSGDATSGDAPPPFEGFDLLPPEDQQRFREIQGGQGAANPSEPAADPAAGLVDKIAMVESGGRADARNPRSSAAGLGQFIDSTWIATMERHAPALVAELPRDALLQLRNDPDISRYMIERHAQDNAQTLQAAGIEPDAGALYLAHFVGTGGAVKVMKADDGASLATLLGQRVIDANPFLKGKNAGWMKRWAARKMEAGRDS